jgi:hypothetical protein
MVNYVIYGHTDYMDVLNIQTDYLESISDKILFINKNKNNNDVLFSKYKKVIFFFSLKYF